MSTESEIDKNRQVRAKVFVFSVAAKISSVENVGKDKETGLMMQTCFFWDLFENRPSGKFFFAIFVGLERPWFGGICNAAEQRLWILNSI